jgi:hypothetical protein
MVSSTFLTFYIPLTFVIFFSIPPAVILVQLAFYEEGLTGVAALRSIPAAKRILSRYSWDTTPAASASGGKDTPVMTQHGCQCRLPFEFGNKLHYNATDHGSAVMDKKGQPSLWCDTGPYCGTPYGAADRQYTKRTCCYDVIVDAKKATIRPNSAWHQDSKKVTEQLKKAAKKEAD